MTNVKSTADAGPVLARKIQAAKSCLRRLRRVVVAFSGGVDSSYLLALAVDTLGSENVAAMMAVSPAMPRRESASAREIAEQFNVELIEIASGEMDDPEYAANSPRRCYLCKRHVMGPMVELAGRRGFGGVICGTNVDDLGDFRPGIRAVEELGVKSPLIEARMTKDDIRAASRAMGLATWDKPSMACLASRVPYGQPLTEETLARIEAGEDALQDLGFRACRLRDHFPVARIEVRPEELTRAVELREQIIERIKALGYKYVTLDLQGFRSGAMNETLTDQQRG